ncbi:MAG: hypothetical protein Kow0047_10210 [Anaerolineae bacterium]
MAKRSRRPQKAARPQRYSRPGAVTTAPAQPVERKRTPAASAAVSSAKVQVDFAKEYHYVIQDLRRLFILAAVLMVLLVVLAYFLT